MKKSKHRKIKKESARRNVVKKWKKQKEKRKLASKEKNSGRVCGNKESQMMVTHISSSQIKDNQMLIHTSNDGQQIRNTNYFDSPHARAGFFQVSINDGCFRLLMPGSQEDNLAEMKTGEYAILTRGVWNGRDAVEIMFEDGTDYPYAITLVTEQFDRLPWAADDGRSDLRLTVYRRQDVGKRPALDLPAAYRVRHSLPCLKRWSGAVPKAEC